MIGIRSSLSNKLGGLYSQAFASKLLPNTSALQFRSYAARNSAIPRFIMPENGLIGDYIPVPSDKRPSIFSMIGFKIALQNWKNLATTTYAIGRIRIKVKGWKPSEFSKEATELYEIMNESFAIGDRETLEKICMMNMLTKLKGDMKKRVGNYEWKKVKDIVPPRIVQARYAKLSMDSFLAQVVVKIEQEQSVAVYNNNKKVIAGDPNKPLPVKEYIVFQKTIGEGSTEWKIYGKLNEAKFYIAA